ncbi:unknown protein [Grouper iridovirus]|uniref:Proliferating cell nuclear antigen n=1 Tax=Grouper iridovirus TaxID=127569 RepID=Q5GAI1_9VIRU|nr:unknown protein [Grouper iridovirus]
MVVYKNSHFWKLSEYKMLWEALTDKPTKLKSLLEVLLHNLDTANIRIDADGMYVHNMQNNILMTVTIPATKFSSYEYTCDASHLFAGLTQTILPDLKTFKAKSAIALNLFGGGEDPMVMKIIVKSGKGGDVSMSLNVVVDQTPLQSDVVHPTDRIQTFTLTQSEFTVLCKTFKQGPVTIGAFKGRLVASGGVDGIKVKEVAFGQPSAELPTVHINMLAEKLLKLHKIGSFSNGQLNVSICSSAFTVSASGDLGSITATVFCERTENRTLNVS